MTNLEFIDFNEVHETAKAFLLSDNEGKEFWIQKRWVRKDGSFTPSAIKAAQNAESKEAKKEVEEASKWTEATVLRETEKAVMIEVVFFKGLGEFEANVWVPKSQMKGNLIPMWIITRKAEEMSQGHARCSVQRVN